MPTRCILLILLQEKGRKKKRYDDSKNFFFTKYVFTLTIREQIRNPLSKTILIGYCESGFFPNKQRFFAYDHWFARRMPDDAWQLAKSALGFGDRR